MKNIIMIGAGGHAKVCIDIIKSQKIFNICGVINKICCQKHFRGYLIIGNDDCLIKLFENIKYAIVGVGSVTTPHIRTEIFNKLINIGYSVPNIIHSAAIVDSSVQLGKGIQIMPGAIVSSDAEISDNCIINSGAIISHDCKIGRNTHITPGAVLGGGVNIGENCVVGMGVTVYFGITIGNNVIINNGQHIMNNVADNTHLKTKLINR